MPLFRRISTSSVSSTGFSSLGCNASASCEGQFTFSNSPNNTGSNQFSFLICERNTQGVNFGQNNSTGYLCLTLKNNYYQQAWKIKNNIIAVGQHVDGTHSEFFDSEINSFVFSEGNSPFQIIDSNVQVRNKSQQSFDTNIYVTESGIKYEFIDSDNTKMKWTSRIEVIQNISVQAPDPFSFSDVLFDISNGTIPANAVFDEGSNNAVFIEAGEDDGTLNDSDVIESGTD